MNKVTTTLIASTIFVLFGLQVLAQSYTENFDDITTLNAQGWVMVNNSNLASGEYFQGDATTFAAFNGASDSYIAADYRATSADGNAVFPVSVSLWLISPTRILRNGDEFSFYTRRIDENNDFPDRLQVRLSTNGNGTNVGTTPVSVGTFTEILLDINEDYQNDYPQTWTLQTVTISGLAEPTYGRIAFRYFLDNTGLLYRENGEYIGIDNVEYTSNYTCPTVEMTPASFPNGNIGTAYNINIIQSDLTFNPVFSITNGSLPDGLSLSANGSISGTPTTNGLFSFTVTVENDEGCIGSEDYTILIECPSVTLTSGGDLEEGVAGVAYNETISQTGYTNPAFSVSAGALPTGLSLSSSGIITGTPTVTGDYDFTITVDNGFSCQETEDYSISIVCQANPLSLNLPSLCDSENNYTLVEGLPAGGSYSGIGVTGNTFDVSQGTQDITYELTDAYNCHFSITNTLTVNDNPIVTLTFDPSTVCNTASPFTLTGGLPEGGTYAGAGVSGGNFNPATAGSSSSITYTYVDGNGCSGSANASLQIQNCVGLSTNDLQAISIYPNPSSGIYTVQLNGEDVITDVVVIDMQGRVVQRIGAINTQHATIDITNEPNGIYFLQASINQQIIHVKLEKLN